MEIIKKVIDFVMDILETVTFVGSLFIVTYLFIVQPNEIRGASMDTTFANGQYILTNKLAYKFGQPTYGDVIVFESPENQDIDYIKRIIATEGDRVMISQNGVFVNGKRMDEPYIQQPTSLIDGGYLMDGQEIVVPPGHVFVMGDNRPRSSDSRVFGPIPLQDVIGEVFFRYFPADKLGTIKNP
jgi:signal peptidase I